MNYNICILMEHEADLSSDELASRAEGVLEKFDSNREVPEYKRYLDTDELASVSKHYATSNLNELAEKLEDWNGERGAVDEHGLYVLTTQNPEGKYDDGYLVDIIPNDQWEYVFLSGTEDLICRAVLTPDGVWHDEWDLMDKELERVERLNKWSEQVRALFKQHESAAAILASLHS